MLLQDDMSFRNVFIRNMTDAFVNTMIGVVNPKVDFEQNTIWEVSGESGSGKSLGTMTLIKKITPKTFSYKNVVFYDQQILELAPTISRDSFIIRDEAVKVWGVGSNRIQSDLVALSETCRKFGISLAFLSPSPQNISVAKFLLQVVDMDIKNRITRFGLKDPVLNKFIGAVYVKVLDNDDYDWVMYNKAKDEFIESIKEGKKAFGKTDFRQIAINMSQKVDINIFRTKKQRLAFLQVELSNLTLSEIKLIHELFEIILVEGEEAIKNGNT